MGEQEVYICYDGKDQVAADAVCSVLEENNINCWLKSRDGSINLEVDEIVHAIEQSKAVVLIFSQFSKQSNYVNTEADIAFGKKLPILGFRIDDSKLDGGLEFFVEERLLIDAFPNSENKFGDLVKNTFKALDRETAQPSMDESKNLIKKFVDESNQRKTIKQKEERSSFFSKFKIPILAILIILIAVAGIFALMNYDDGIGGTSEAQKDLPNMTMKITDFHVSDVRKQGLDWNYTYFVSGTVSPQPGADDGYKIVVDFFDKSGELVDSIETPFSEAQIVDNGFLFGSIGSDSNNIKRVDAQLINDKNIVICQAESNL